jgi:hypothetical protein
MPSFKAVSIAPAIFEAIPSTSSSDFASSIPFPASSILAFNASAVVLSYFSFIAAFKLSRYLIPLSFADFK